MVIEALVVLDDVEQRQLISSALGSLGWMVREASSAEEGLRLAAESAPNLVVTDVQLPGRSAFDLWRGLRLGPPLSQVPVLMITGTYNREEDRQRALGAKGNAFLQKPFRLQEFLRIARRLAQAREA